MITQGVSDPSDTSSSSAAELLDRVGRADDAAWRSLIERYGVVVRAIARRYDLTPDEAADVAQATWMALLAHAHEVRDPERLVGWIATTARHECWRQLRRRSREVLTSDHRDDGHDPDWVDRLERERRGQLLRKAIAELPPRQAALISVMLEPSEPSYQEISRRLDMPIGSIGPNRQRALRRLQASLAPHLASTEVMSA